MHGQTDITEHSICTAYRRTHRHGHVSTLNYLITATDAFCMALFTLFCVIVGEGVTADKQTTGDLDSMCIQRIHNTDNEYRSSSDL